MITGSKLDIAAKISQPRGERQVWRREISSGEALEAATQTIVRKITAEDLAEAHTKLFPEERLASQKKKPKLSER